MTEINSSFSKFIPGLQFALDSTSTGEFKLCPQRYYLGIVEGWRPKTESHHLQFGILLHSGREHYERAKAKGQGHEEALDSTVDFVLRATWDKVLNRPWATGSSTKNRLTLIRSLVWYLDQYGPNDPLRTIIFSDGSPAVELSFRFDSGIRFANGESVLLCGHIDRLVDFNDEGYVDDMKSTEHTIDAGYFLKFSPDNQFSLYSLAGKVAFKTEVKGVILNAVQTLVGGTRFRRGLIPRSQSQLDEWFEDTKLVIREMEFAAISGHWRMNDKACHFPPCVFREVCSRPPATRRQWLELNYTQRTWDPLKRRGDV
jgi:hypothetical protein